MNQVPSQQIPQRPMPPGMQGQPAAYYPNAAQPPQQPSSQHANQPPIAQQQQQQQQPPHQHQPAIDPEQKNLQDIFESLALINNIRDSINIILDNVGKTNPANSYTVAYQAARKLNQEANGQQQQPQQSNGTELEHNQLVELNEKFFSLNSEQMKFLEQTDSKYLTDRVNDINNNLKDLDRIIKELKPIQMFNQSDLAAVFLDQYDDKKLTPGVKVLSNYRWIIKLQEMMNSTTLVLYKRYQQPYSERKSNKIHSHPPRPIKKEDLEKLAAMSLTLNEIKVTCAQKTEYQFILDIIMPQHFKFVFLLFGSQVEKLQVKLMDNKLIRAYGSNLPSDEICTFDFENNNLSKVFQRLEDNCLFACAYFKAEYGQHHLRYILHWIKNYSNLFNSRCHQCDKHLLNGVPPTWRDLKTSHAFHDECRN